MEERPVRLGRSFLMNFGASVATLVLTLLSGILTARLLGPEGRGEYAAISGWALTLAAVGCLGYPGAATFLLSRYPQEGRNLLGTTLLAVVALGVFAVVLAQLFLAPAFAAQETATLNLARVYVLALPAYIGLMFVCALLGGLGRFGELSLVRIAQPLLFGAGLMVLAAADAFTVMGVLAVLACSYVVPFVVGTGRIVRIQGLARPSAKLARKGLGYGLRVQGQTLGALGNSRLDTAVLPAFVVATQLGYYSIAVSVASMVVVMFGQLVFVVFPVATRAGDRDGPVLVARTTRLVLLLAGLAALALGLAAPLCVRVVYGREYLPGVAPLRLLLPGVVFWSATSIVDGGLQALNRPGRASVAQLVGFFFTVVGLATTVPHWGIVGAAATSTLAYTVAFALSLRFFSAASGQTFREVLSPSALASDLAWLLQRARRRVTRLPCWPSPAR